MNVKDFSSWRILATAYGHEHVHRIVTGDYSQELFDAGFGFLRSGSWKFPHFYNELLAHTWSNIYSGIGGEEIITLHENMSKQYKSIKNNNENVVRTFYKKHKLLP